MPSPRLIPRQRRAFTLIELLAVLGVLAVLAALAVGIVNAAKHRSASARARGELAALAAALERYKSHYGDYPQTGNGAQATPTVTAVIGQNQAQALLLNALIGVYGPTNFSTRINGPSFLEVSKFRLEVQLNVNTAARFGEPQGTPPVKTAEANCLLDPWGYRYMYYYKPAPAPGRPPVNTWRAPASVLYSVGPDGQHTAPATATGLFTGTAETTGTNADNIRATP